MMQWAGHTLLGHKYKSLFKLKRWWNTWQVVELIDPPGYISDKFGLVIAHECNRFVCNNWWAFSMPEKILEDSPECQSCHNRIPDKVFCVWQMLNMDEEK